MQLNILVPSTFFTLFAAKALAINERSLYSYPPFKLGVVRVIGNDIQTTLTSSQLYNAFFDMSGDNITLASRISDCSLGQASVIPYAGNGFVGGVATYTTSNNIANADARELALVIAESFFPNGLDSKEIDAFVVCSPEATRLDRSFSWVADSFGPNESPIAVIQDSYCDLVGAQAYVYASKTYMETAADRTELHWKAAQEHQELCFNAPNTDVVGWYSDYTLTISDPMNELPATVDLIGIGDVGSASEGDVAIVKIKLGNDFSDAALDEVYEDQAVFVQLNVNSGLTSQVFEYTDGSWDTPPVPNLSLIEAYNLTNAVTGEFLQRYHGLVNYFVEGAFVADPSFLLSPTNNLLAFRVQTINASSTPSTARVRFFVCNSLCQETERMRHAISYAACQNFGLLCYI